MCHTSQKSFGNYSSDYGPNDSSVTEESSLHLNRRLRWENKGSEEIMERPVLLPGWNWYYSYGNCQSSCPEIWAARSSLELRRRHLKWFPEYWASLDLQEAGSWNKMVELFLEIRKHLLAPPPHHPYDTGQAWCLKKNKTQQEITIKTGACQNCQQTKPNYRSH